MVKHVAGAARASGILRERVLRLVVKPVAGYFRVSQARDDMNAPEIYRHEIERYCAYKGVELARIYSDIDYSGWRGARTRPALERLVTDRHSYSAVVIPKLSRFGRSVSQLVSLFDVFDGDGIALVFLDMNIDTSTSQGRLLRNVMAAFAEYESDVKSDYAKAAAVHTARLGRAHGGEPPFGYANDPATKSYLVMPERAAVVTEVFERYVRGETSPAIAATLRQRGVSTSKGGCWVNDAVMRMIRCLTYTGYRRVGDELLRATWEPIISLDLWRQAQKVREDRKRARNLVPLPKGTPRPVYLLTGLLVCGACGRRLHHRAYRKAAMPRFCCPSDSAYARGPKCSGGSIVRHRAERLVTEAFLSSYWATLLSKAGTDVKAMWDQGDVQARRALLTQAIEKVVLVPRPNATDRKTRSLKVVWRNWSEMSGGMAEVTVNDAEPDTKRCVACGYRRNSRAFRWMGAERDETCTACRKKEAFEKSLVTAVRPQVTSPASMSWAEFRRERILFKL